MKNLPTKSLIDFELSNKQCFSNEKMSELATTGKESIRDIISRKKIKTYKLRYEHYKKPELKPEMMTSNPFVASYPEMGAMSRDQVKPHKHMTPTRDSFGIISKSNERFEREKCGTLHDDEIESNLRQLNQVFGFPFTSEKVMARLILYLH